MKSGSPALYAAVRQQARATRESERTMMQLARTFVAAALFTLSASPAPAQMFSNFAGQTAMNNLIMANVNQRGQRNAYAAERGKASATRDAATATSDFAFSPSPQLRRNTVNEFLTSLSRSDPGNATNLRNIHAKDDLIEQINRRLPQAGLNPNNLADAYALWWVASWEAAHQRDMGMSKTMYHAVRQQVVAAMGNSPLFRQFNNGQKQKFTESLLLHSLLIDQARVSSLPKDEIGKAVTEGARKMGLDLNAMTLTQTGFVPANGG